MSIEISACGQKERQWVLLVTVSRENGNLVCFVTRKSQMYINTDIKSVLPY